MSPIALPRSPQTSTPNLLSPSYNRSTSGYSRSNTSPYGLSRGAEIRDEIINNAEKIQRRVMATYRRMSPLQRILVIAGLVVINVGFVIFLIFNERIFGFLEPFAEKWKHTTGGWTILWALTFLTAFPPLIGYSTCGTMAGFVYGVGEGWLIYATATVAGSFCSFIVSRTLLRKYVERMVANDKRFAALTLTLKEDGLKLLCMIRLCPLPYSLSNGAMSTFPTVEPSAYALATACISPKLLIHVFIGSRLAKIAKNKDEMTLGDKALNWASIIFFGLLGASVGWFIYRKTMQRARELEAEEQERVRDSTRRTGAPPPEFTDDPEAQAAAGILARDEDDDVAYFDEGPSPQPYRDSTSEEDIFAKGDGGDDA
ncbi:Tlg2-vesicle protein [Lithohypha guttulata]|uniref:Golgi apparatus membrane protein TVP38 n=1 Tax=Lithohypha guttulata TaxID=1690604 RepID=A0AAN7STK3_9EURO|nr:Tlg2-vesicle protein [Lithohypha guttulata]KAK5081162.1 Tlg2-vesicle protein [Lithohypha guttulata]KAK5096138.1 Tlg2-vesicle protein [Lithohypha guttulata]